MNLDGVVPMVTGANRGLGLEIVRALSSKGVSRIYAGARKNATFEHPGIVPVNLDITNDEQVATAAAECADVNLLINNAGIAGFTPLIGSPNMNGARREMETNYFGTLNMCRRFAPVLIRNGGGMIVNILSTSSWVNNGILGSYSASKAAELSLTMGVRIELREHGVTVAALHCGYIETEMVEGLRGSKARPQDIAQALVRGVEGDQEEILADNRAQAVKSALCDLSCVEQQLQEAWDQRDRVGTGR